MQIAIYLNFHVLDPQIYDNLFTFPTSKQTLIPLKNELQYTYLVIYDKSPLLLSLSLFVNRKNKNPFFFNLVSIFVFSFYVVFLYVIVQLLWCFLFCRRPRHCLVFIFIVVSIYSCFNFPVAFLEFNCPLFYLLFKLIVVFHFIVRFVCVVSCLPSFFFSFLLCDFFFFFTYCRFIFSVCFNQIAHLYSYIIYKYMLSLSKVEIIAFVELSFFSSCPTMRSNNKHSIVRDHLLKPVKWHAIYWDETLDFRARGFNPAFLYQKTRSNWL